MDKREVMVIHPQEVKVPKEKHLKLWVALYGLNDAVLCFHLQVKQVMKGLGVKHSRYDPALFYDQDDSTRETIGLMGLHEYNFLLAGKTAWVKETTTNIQRSSCQDQQHAWVVQE